MKTIRTGDWAWEQSLKGCLDTRSVNLLAKVGVTTVGDLLRWYPRRYLNSTLKAVELVPGDFAVCVLDVLSSRFVPMPIPKNRRRGRVEAILTDGHVRIRATWFNQFRLHEDFEPGKRGLFAGKVGSFRDELQLGQPDRRMFPGGSDDAVHHRSEVFPIYRQVYELSSWTLQDAIAIALDLVPEIPEALPEEVRREHGLVDVRTALNDLHRPASFAALDRGIERIKFEEGFLVQTAFAQRRALTQSAVTEPRRGRPDAALAEFDAAVPFTLTGGQVDVGQEIAADLQREYPMYRLLQGDVGSGKTLVALRAMLQVVDSGGQAVLLAPTEVLAAQHYASITALLGPLAGGGMLGGSQHGTKVVLLTGSMTATARKAALLDAASGEAGIVVGTHALLEDRVQFADLGLVVVDEQHRFGVEQRDALRGKGNTVPHTLVMTATPIPRSVAMTIFGDLDTSSLRELPAGRTPIATHFVPSARPGWMDRVWLRVREACDAGHQAYVVCARIGADDEPEPDPDEGPRMMGALEVLEALRATPVLQGLRIGLLHGRLPSDEKDRVMRDFAAGQLDVLVATTVIEVGVDVPNATVMVIIDADRFGISQLHQLRGRVGRGEAAGTCFLVSAAAETEPPQRLAAVVASTDGFELAEADLQLRGAGDLLGADQSGWFRTFRKLTMADVRIIEAARASAHRIIEADPTLERHPALARAVAAAVDAVQAEYLERA